MTEFKISSKITLNLFIILEEINKCYENIKLDFDLKVFKKFF